METQLTAVINVRDGERFIAETLRSLQRQTFPVRILVVDNHSKDSTEQIVRRADGAEYVKTPSPLALGAARNFSLDFVKTPYVSWLDADDLWTDDFSALYHAGFRRYPEAVLFSSCTLLIDEHSRLLPFWQQRLARAHFAGRSGAFSPGETEEDLWIRLRQRYGWSSYVFRRQTVQEAGGFNLRFHYAEDTDLIYKVLRRGKAYHLNCNTNMNRIHGEQNTHRIPPTQRYEEIREILLSQNRVPIQEMNDVIGFKIRLGEAARSPHKLKGWVPLFFNRTCARWMFRRLWRAERHRRVLIQLLSPPSLRRASSLN